MMDWYPFFVTEWRRDTYHLSAAAKGIYRELIDEYMLAGGPLPDNDLSLAAIARVSAQEWGEHRDAVRAFFKARDGKLVHKRCEQELNAQRIRAAKRSRNAKEAATVRWAKEKQKQWSTCDEHAGSNANAMRQPATLHNKSISLTSSEEMERQRTFERECVASSEVASIIRAKGWS